jgi:hypothetical protein
VGAGDDLHMDKKRPGDGPDQLSGLLLLLFGASSSVFVRFSGVVRLWLNCFDTVI